MNELIEILSCCEELEACPPIMRSGALNESREGKLKDQIYKLISTVALEYIHRKNYVTLYETKELLKKNQIKFVLSLDEIKKASHLSRFLDFPLSGFISSTFPLSGRFWAMLKCVFRSQSSRIETLTFTRDVLVDSLMLEIQNLNNLEELNLYSCRIDDKDYAFLPLSLKSLTIRRSNSVGPLAINRIAQMSSLTKLDFYASNISDAEGAKLPLTLEVLNLEFNRAIGRKTMGRIVQMTSLRELSLAGCSCLNFYEIRDLPKKLQSLSLPVLSLNSISSESIIALHALKKIRLTADFLMDMERIEQICAQRCRMKRGEIERFFAFINKLDAVQLPSPDDYTPPVWALSE
jgi:hypothetical protein